jgi:hypothetical protein
VSTVIEPVKVLVGAQKHVIIVFFRLKFQSDSATNPARPELNYWFVAMEGVTELVFDCELQPPPTSSAVVHGATICPILLHVVGVFVLVKHNRPNAVHLQKKGDKASETIVVSNLNCGTYVRLMDVVWCASTHATSVYIRPMKFHLE